MNQYSGIPFFINQEPGSNPFEIIIQTIGGIPIVVSNEDERLLLTGSEDMGVFQLTPPGVFLFKNSTWNLIGTSGSSGGGGSVDLSDYTGSVDITGSTIQLNRRILIPDEETEDYSGLGIVIDSGSIKIGTAYNDYGEIDELFGIELKDNGQSISLSGNVTINGDYPVAKNPSTTAIGIGATSVGNKSISIGYQSISSVDSLSFGYKTHSSGSNSIAFGNSVLNVNPNSMIIGVKSGSALTSPVYVGIQGNEYGDIQNTIYQSDTSPIDSGNFMSIGSCPPNSLPRKTFTARLNASADTLNIFVNVNGTIKKGTISLIDV